MLLASPGVEIDIGLMEVSLNNYSIALSLYISYTYIQLRQAKFAFAGGGASEVVLISLYRSYLRSAIGQEQGGRWLPFCWATI